jgi:glucose-6-phosphate-specific signal transduction histidine kinase
VVGVARWIGWLPVLLRAPGPDDVELRRGLERVLHDEVAIGLSAMVLRLDLISAVADEDSELAAKVGVARVSVCQLIEDVRRLGGIVFSPVLRGSGLAPALRAAAEYRELRLRLDLPAHDLDVEAQSRVGLLVMDRLNTVCSDAEVRVWVRGRRLVRVRITEKRPGRPARRYWAVAACG